MVQGTETPTGHYDGAGTLYVSWLDHDVRRHEPLIDRIEVFDEGIVHVFARASRDCDEIAPVLETPESGAEVREKPRNYSRLAPVLLI